MRPYIQSGLREYAAATLYENKIITYPKGVQVTYRGPTPVFESGSWTVEDGFDLTVTTKAGDQILVTLSIPEPLVEKHFDQGILVGDKCVVYLGAHQPRTIYFISIKSGTIILQDNIVEPSSMLAWMAISPILKGISGGSEESYLKVFRSAAN